MKTIAVLLSWLVVAPLCAADEALSAQFGALLDEAELQFNRPEGFVYRSPGSTPVLDY